MHRLSCIVGDKNPILGRENQQLPHSDRVSGADFGDKPNYSDVLSGLILFLTISFFSLDQTEI